MTCKAFALEEHVQASFNARLWNGTTSSYFVEDGTFDVQNIIVVSVGLSLSRVLLWKCLSEMLQCEVCVLHHCFTTDVIAYSVLC